MGRVQRENQVDPQLIDSCRWLCVYNNIISDCTHQLPQAILKRIQMVRPQYNVKRWVSYSHQAQYTALLLQQCCVCAVQESEYHSHVERTRNLSQLLPALEPSTATRVGRERPRDQTAGESLHLPPIHRSRPETQPVSRIVACAVPTSSWLHSH